MKFLCIKDLKIEEINKIFSMADLLSNNILNNNNDFLLKNKTFVLFFPESSIRTRLSFEKGIKELGGDCILFPPSTLDKRELLLDVGEYINNWADGIIVRHSDYGKVVELSKANDIPVINAMTSYNHPCEILSDIYSISKIRKDYMDLVYTFVGGGGNIINSWVAAAKVFGFSLNHVSRDEYRIKEDDNTYKFTSSLESVLSESDVILTDPLPLELRTDEHYNKYQITLEKMKVCKVNAILNPCPPFYRGEEVSADVIESEYFAGYEFKKNLIYVQQAIILYCLGISII